MDTNAFYRITQGLYILGSKDGNRDVGCLVDVVMQMTNQPLILAFFVCDVIQMIVVESNTLFLGCVIMAKVNKDREPLTYRYY